MCHQLSLQRAICELPAFSAVAITFLAPPVAMTCTVIHGGLHCFDDTAGVVPRGVTRKVCAIDVICEELERRQIVICRHKVTGLCHCQVSEIRTVAPVSANDLSITSKIRRLRNIRTIRRIRSICCCIRRSVRTIRRVHPSNVNPVYSTSVLP